MKKIVLFLLFFYCSVLGAEVVLHLTLVHKKGINKGLVLVSELHSLEKIREHQTIVMIMKNGHMVKLKAKFMPEQSETGKVVFIEGQFFEDKESDGVSFSKEGILAHVNEEKNIELKNSGDQLLLLRVLPQRL